MNGHFVQWGAGNIGRAFIGQIFATNGYTITFIDIDKTLIKSLQDSGRYTVETVFYEESQKIDVTGVTAINAGDTPSVSAVITKADILGVSVGKNAWPHIVKELAKAISDRFAVRPDKPLDIILAENIYHCKQFVTELLKPHFIPDFPFDSYIGLIETSIGKMVPIQNTASLSILRAEPYNELIVDRDGFINQIPSIKQLHPVSSIGAYVDRKLFIHNMGHACTAYLGFKRDQSIKLINQVLADPSIKEQVRQTMMQAANIVVSMYPQVFNMNSLEIYVDDLLLRFCNYSLADSVFRIGRDLPRKLRFDDRFVGCILAAQVKGLDWSLIGNAYVSAFFFRCKGPDGNVFAPDQEFLDTLGEMNIERKFYFASCWQESKLSLDLYEKINAKLMSLLD